MRRLFFIVISIVGLQAARAVEAELLAAAEAAEAGFDPQGALRHYLELEKLHPCDAGILQRIARQYSDATNVLESLDDKRRYARQALAYSQRAAELEPANPVNVLSVAISYGKLAIYSDTRDKLAYSRKLKEHAEAALALDPGYAWAHHVLGRWHHEVASLGGPTRFIVRMIYGGLPEASKERAVEHLRIAVALDPDNLIHHLELGFAMWAIGARDSAREHFQIGLAMEETTINDAAAKQRARAALAQT